MFCVDEDIEWKDMLRWVIL